MAPPAQLFIAIVLAMAMITLFSLHFPRVVELFPNPFPYRSVWVHLLRALAVASLLAFSVSAGANLIMVVFGAYGRPIDDELLWKTSVTLLLSPVILLLPWSIAHPYMALVKNLPGEYLPLAGISDWDDFMTPQLEEE
jgi:hypothetical protein